MIEASVQASSWYTWIKDLKDVSVAQIQKDFKSLKLGNVSIHSPGKKKTSPKNVFLMISKLHCL